MIKIFDKYIIKKYLVTFVFTMLMITMIAVTINFFENVDKLLTPDLTLKQVFGEYYLNFIPWINGLLWPMFSLISVIFFTSRLAKDSEIVSLLASGVSYNRFLRPYFIGAGILAMLLWYGNNYLIPNSSKIKNEFEAVYIRRSAKKTMATDVHFFLAPGEKVYIRNFSSRDSTARNFRLERFDGPDLVYVLKASMLQFVGEPNHWKMVNYEERFIDSMDENFIRYDGQERDTVFDMHPDDFVRYTKQMEMMTTTDLRTFIRREREKGLDSAKKYTIELYRRSADPFTILILTIIGVCIASRKVRGGMGFHLAAGIMIGASFVILSKFSVTFATNLALPSGLGVWIPNIIFSVIAFYLYLKAQK